NCGGCGIKCGGICNNGVCCGVNDIVCNGKCTNIKGDNQNCGQCGKICPNNTPTCVNGVCSVGCADANDVLFNGKCFYLDGSGGACDNGYALSNNVAMGQILMANANAWQGKNYKHTVSSNCCVLTSDNVENYGM